MESRHEKGLPTDTFGGMDYEKDRRKNRATIAYLRELHGRDED